MISYHELRLLSLPKALLDMMKDEPPTYTRPVGATPADAEWWLNDQKWTSLDEITKAAPRLAFLRWLVDEKRCTDGGEKR